MLSVALAGLVRPRIAGSRSSSSAQTYLDQCNLALNNGELSDKDPAGLNWWTSEVQWEIMDRGLQIHGGYGYINEYEVARLRRDARVRRRHGGATEIMKDLMGRSTGTLDMTLLTCRPRNPGWPHEIQLTWQIVS
jgi:hypothetical protein